MSLREVWSFSSSGLKKKEMPENYWVRLRLWAHIEKETQEAKEEEEEDAEEEKKVGKRKMLRNKREKGKILRKKR
jgi:hypothetical protein